MMLRSVLLVEDDQRDIELTLTALKRCRLANDVVVVPDGAAALEYLHCEGAYAGRTVGNPAVIVLDLKLPKINGLEVLELLRASDALREVPVVMLTSSNEPADIERSTALGVQAYVVKPPDFRTFVALLGNLDALWAVAQRTVDTP